MLKIFKQAYYRWNQKHFISLFSLEIPVDADGRDKVGLCHRDNKAESEDICASNTSNIFLIFSSFNAQMLISDYYMSKK